MSTNARQFLEEIADGLRAKGRTVEITESTHDWGTFVWMSSIAPSWYEKTITLSARYNERTKRWALGELSVDHGTITRKTRGDIRITANVYA